MRNADVIIAGGGVIGMAAAFALTRAGVRVTLIDAGAPPATRAAAGMLAPSFEGSLHGAGAALAAFSAQSLERWRTFAPEIEALAGVDIDYRTDGVLSVIFEGGADDAHGFDGEAFDADAQGGAVLSRDDVLALEPSIAPSVIAGRFAAREGQVDPRKALLALERAFAGQGGRLRRGAAVEEIISVGGRVSGVALRGGERLSAPIVVLATGARIAGLAALALDAAFPVKGEALAIERVAGSPRCVVRTPRAYLCPKSDGRVVIGATEIVRDWTLAPGEAGIALLRRGANTACPALKGAREIERWAGLRPATIDGAPIIGPAPDGPDGLIYALGHYRNGVLLAPATADAVAEIVRTARLPTSLAAFSASRFTNLGVS